MDADDTTDTPSANINNWQLSNPTEVGGRIWDTNEAYLTGDVVSFGGIVYYAVSDSTTFDNDPSVNTTDWNILNQEKGGVIFAAGTAYALGDIITNAGTAYVCSTEPTPNPGAFEPTDWTAIGGDLSLLTTTANTDLVAAINEVDGEITTIQQGTAITDFTVPAADLTEVSNKINEILVVLRAAGIAT